jgi:uncharacterized protein involved in exopolysaccharide biosynthesis
MRVLRTRPLLLGTCGLIGAALGMTVAQQLPTSYEAIGVVRLAQVGEVMDGKASVRLAESPAEAVQRLQMPSFLQDTGLGDPPAAGHDIVSKLVVRRVRETDLLEIRYRSPDPDAARQALEKVLAQLRSRHEALTQPAKALLQEQLDAVQGLRAQSLEMRRSMLQNLGGSSQDSLRKEFPLLQLAFVGSDNDLARWELAVRTAMSPPSTAPTRLVEPVVLDQMPRVRKMLVLGLGGLAAGIFAAVIWALRQPDKAARID